MVVDNIKKEFGSTIKHYRLKQNISQEKLAEVTELHRTYISEVERGIRNISLVNINKLCIALEVSISELFETIEKTRKGEVINEG